MSVFMFPHMSLWTDNWTSHYLYEITRYGRKEKPVTDLALDSCDKHCHGNQRITIAAADPEISSVPYLLFRTFFPLVKTRLPTLPTMQQAPDSSSTDLGAFKIPKIVICTFQLNSFSFKFIKCTVTISTHGPLISFMILVFISGWSLTEDH